MANHFGRSFLWKQYMRNIGWERKMSEDTLNLDDLSLDAVELLQFLLQLPEATREKVVRIANADLEAALAASSDDPTLH